MQEKALKFWPIAESYGINADRVNSNIVANIKFL